MTPRNASTAAAGEFGWKKRISSRLVVALTIAMSLVWPDAAMAEELRRADVVKLLSEQYAETQQAVGLTTGGDIVEIFAANDGSSWTLVLTEADGNSRVIAAGESWIIREPAKPE